jgi:L-ribulose-5-phosphate 3-epimerase
MTRSARRGSRDIGGTGTGGTLRRALANDKSDCSVPSVALSLPLTPPMTRRDFLLSSGAAASLTLAASATDTPSRAPARAPRLLRKGFMLGTLNSDSAKALSLEARFRLLRDAGFAGVEVNSALDQKEVLAARDRAGLEIPSVVVATHWARPLTDANPAIRAEGLEGVRQALRDAHAYGAASVLLVPGVVTKDVSYSDAYTRSIAAIRDLLPLAESLGVAIAIENVWNRFLLSPLEAAAYVDQFQSRWVRWHFDVGNIVNYGWPEQWIRTLGPRIVQVHAKEYSRSVRDKRGPFAGFQVELLEGDSDWPATVAALDAVGYRGWLITEQWRPPEVPDAEWLARLSGHLDRILAL